MQKLWADQERGLHEPLIHAYAGHYEGRVEELPPTQPKSSVPVCCLNLACIILGAGMFALPAAFSGLGLLCGIAMVAAVAVMTYLSVVVVLRASERSKRLTYAETLGFVWGRHVAAAVRGSIIVACFMFLVMYLDILCDVTVGGADYSGVISDLFPSLPKPLPWYLSRNAMLTWCVLAVTPLLPARTLGGLARVSAFKVTCALLCMAALALLAAAAALQGKLHHRLLPDPAMYGPGWVKTLTQVMGTVPVVMTALICQYNIHPLMRDLRNYTPGRMRKVVGVSLAGTALMYAIAGGCGYAVFGRTVKGDVLASLNCEVVGDLLGGPKLGLAFVAAIKVAVSLVMLSSFPMVMFILRADLIDGILGVTGGASMSNKGYYTVTYVTLALIYLAAILVKSAYQMTGLVGAVCGIAVGFVFPGMLAWKGEAGAAWKVFAAVLVVVGITLMGAGIAAPFLERSDGSTGSTLGATVVQGLF
ncbi:hypothetical protein N2152v2_007272 [Parachlorella kessleri]